MGGGPARRLGLAGDGGRDRCLRRPDGGPVPVGAGPLGEGLGAALSPPLSAAISPATPVRAPRALAFRRSRLYEARLPRNHAPTCSGADLSATEHSPPEPEMNLRNVAIIAHVDHGKTTLVDQLLAQSGVFRANEATTERAMDSNDQERERGITILAKATSVLGNGKAGETRINIIDTPGPAAFGGEVDRILGMVGGCVLLVDAEEGVMPQTKCVLTKALKMGLKPILCINKVDRTHADPDRVHLETIELFEAIGASPEQLDFPHIYASGRNGWATLDLNQPSETLAPLFDLLVDPVPPPPVAQNVDQPFRMLNVLIESDPFLGRLLTGRIESGKAVPGMPIKALSRDGKQIEQGRITKVLAFRGLKRQPVEEGAEAGDIVAIAGMSKATVADTLCALEVTEPLDAQPIEP